MSPPRNRFTLFCELVHGHPGWRILSEIIDSGLFGSTDFHRSHPQGYGGRGSARAEDAPGTPTQSNVSPSILDYTKIILFRKGFPPSVLQRERIFVEVLTSDRKFNASREVPK